MKRFLMAAALVACAPVAAMADGCCGVSDAAAGAERLAGSWVREGSTSVEGSTTSFVRPARMFATEIDAEGQFYSGFVDSIMGEEVALRWAAPKPYDVEQVG